MAFDPAALGDNLIVVGKKQVDTGGKVKKAAVKLRDIGRALAAGAQIDTSLGSIRTGVRSIRNLLGPVVTALQFIVNTLNGIRIPTITPTTRVINFPVIGQVRFVTGITIGSVRPFTGIAGRVNTVRTNFVNVRAALNTVAGDLRAMRNQLPNFRRDLLSTADEMDSGGTDLIDLGNELQTAGTALGGS